MSLWTLFNWIGDRMATLPLAIVYVTDRCNSRCISCDFWRHGETDLAVDRAHALAWELRKMATETVLLTGGEPLFHPRWDAVAESLHDAGLDLWLLTAGLSLEKESRRVTELCRRITVSLDAASPQTYQFIRGVDGFHTVCRGIRSAVAQGAWVSVRTTVQKGNFREMPDLVRLAKRLGAREISFLGIDVAEGPAFARRNGRGPLGALEPKELPVLAEILSSMEDERGFIAESREKLWCIYQYFSALVGEAPFPPVRCNAPRFSAVIKPDGSIQPCFFIGGIGGLSGKRTLSAGLNSRKLRDIRRDIREGSRNECKRCVCSMWRSAGELVFRNGGF